MWIEDGTWDGWIEIAGAGWKTGAEKTGAGAAIAGETIAGADTIGAAIVGAAIDGAGAAMTGWLTIGDSITDDVIGAGDIAGIGADVIGYPPTTRAPVPDMSLARCDSSSIN